MEDLTSDNICSNDRENKIFRFLNSPIFAVKIKRSDHVNLRWNTNKIIHISMHIFALADI